MILKSANIHMTFGKNVRKARANQGLSQQALADKSGVHRTNISTIESGYDDARMSTVEKIAWGLQISVSELVKEDYEKE